MVSLSLRKRKIHKFKVEIVKKTLLTLAISASLFANDIIIKESCTSVDDTAQKLKEIVKSKGLNVFAIINHGGNAQMVDMKLDESKMVIFGNAKFGTALMQQDMKIGLDLPLRVLIFKDSDGKVKMAYRDGTWLDNKHIINAPKKVAKLNKAMENFTTRAGQCSKD
jgi:uncharacterized protein (DUF302 family)